MSQHGGFGRRSLRGAASAATAALLALTLSSCGDDWDIPEPPEVTTSSTQVGTEGPGIGPTAGPVDPGEPPVGEAPPYEGWTSLSEAVQGLEPLGIACAEFPEDGMALCEPAAVLSYGISMQSFETALSALEDEVPEYRVVADGDWILACEAAFTGACERVSEYTGVSMNRMN